MKKITMFYRSLTAAVLLLLSGHLAPGQSYADSLAQDDREIISSIAPYPADVRNAILDVAQYPQVIVKLERIQARSSQSFQDLIAGFPREEQEKFYEASRFPDMVSQLVRTNSLGTNEIRVIVKDLPEQTQERMISLYQSHYNEMVKMNEMYEASQGALQKIIGEYPQNVQSDFQKVISMPDVMNLMTDNIDLTVSLGEDYKANPADVNRRLEELSGKITTQNEKDLNEYKAQVANDPKLQSEMRSAAQDFSSSYDHPDNPVYVTNNYYDNYPYPYWFSYPYWYNVPIWYPRPLYYHTGFYYGPGGAIVVVGLPSLYWSTWFFGNGYRHYPLLYHHYNTFYNNHRGWYSNVYRGFNREAHTHFSDRDRAGRDRNYGTQNNRGGDRNVNRNRNSGSANFSGRQTTTRPGSFNTPAQRNARMGQMNVQPNSMNNRGLNQYHATQFHSMGWQKVGGGVRNNPGNSFGGGTRSGGFSGGSKGGSTGGGSHGGGGGRRGR